MSRFNRYAKKVDANQATLVGFLEALGFSVETKSSRIGEGFPDIVVGGEMPCPCCGLLIKQNKLIEIKASSLDKLNPKQKEWHGDWKGQKDIARTTQDLVRILGLEWRPGVRFAYVAVDESGYSETARVGEDEIGALHPDPTYPIHDESWVRPDVDSGNTGTEGAA